MLRSGSSAARPPLTAGPYRLAVLCGVVPLLAGAAIFTAWTLTGWRWLMLAGLVTIGIGTVVFLVGCLALYSAHRRARDAGAMQGLTRRTLLAAALLVSNFPAAAGLSWAAVALETRLVVVVRNDAVVPLEGGRLHGGGADVRLPALAPGASVERWLWFDTDGQLELDASLGGQHVHGVVAGYVTGGLGGRLVVTVRADGTITALQAHR